MTRNEATNLAHKHKIDLSKSFFTLRTEEVDRVLAAANEYKYRKPRNANGSRARYFFALLQRAAARKQ